MREIGYRRFWQLIGAHAPGIMTIDLGPLTSSGDMYREGYYGADGAWCGTKICRLEASDTGSTWEVIGELPMSGFVVPEEHRQHRYWRVFYRVDQPVPSGFDNMAYWGGTYCRDAHFWDENGTDLLAGMYTNPSSMQVLGEVRSIWYQQLWGWGLVGGMNGGPAGGVSSGGVILAQSGSHTSLYTDCTYSPVPFLLYGWWGFAETVWGTPGGFEVTWTWDLTGHDIVPGEGPAGEIEEGWGAEVCQVLNGRFATTATPGRGTMSVFDKETGMRLMEGTDWELVTEVAGYSTFSVNTDSEVVVVYYRNWGLITRSRPARGRIGTGNVLADRVRFSDPKGL